MLPNKVKKRASLLAIFLSVSVISIFLILSALNKNILYFNSPLPPLMSVCSTFTKILPRLGIPKSVCRKIAKILARLGFLKLCVGRMQKSRPPSLPHKCVSDGCENPGTVLFPVTKTQKQEFCL